MESLCMRLEACAPALGRFRAYRIVAGRDLFGVWMVEMTYGRIGTLGRTKALSFDRVEDAVVAVRESLRRRATAPRRIGVAYRVLTVDCDADWTAVKGAVGMPSIVGNASHDSVGFP
jgi:predicted DNA-binding WGR domain protein